MSNTNTSGKISGDPAAVTTTGLSFAAIQAGNNVQVPIALLDSHYAVGGTVTSVTVEAANGFYATILNPTTAADITISTSIVGLIKGDGTSLLLAGGADLPSMTATVGGAVPTPPNDTSMFLRGDGVFATPAGSGTVTHSAGALTASALMVGNGAADAKVLASLGTTTTLLHGNAAGLPTFGAVSLTADVSGTLPIANGGTALTTLTAHGVLIGNGTSAPTFVAPGTSGNSLKSNGTDWVSSATTASGLTLIGTLTTTSGTTQTATGLATTYTNLQVVFDNVAISVAAGININISSDNGASFDTAILLTSGGTVGNGTATIARTGATANKILASVNNGTAVTGRYTTKTSPTNAIRLTATSGTFSSGAVYIYGVP